jgi:hypothetical protein
MPVFLNSQYANPQYQCQPLEHTPLQTSKTEPAKQTLSMHEGRFTLAAISVTYCRHIRSSILFLAGQRLSSNQEANAAVEGYFADLTKNPYREEIMALEHRWNKCISLKGDYVEKYK